MISELKLEKNICSNYLDLSKFADCYKTVSFECPRDYIIINGVRYGYQGGDE